MYCTHAATEAKEDAAQEDDNLCCLCEKEISVRLSPCGHAIMCSDCASEAKRCPKCRVSNLSHMNNRKLLLLPPQFCFLAGSNKEQRDTFKIALWTVLHIFE